MRGPCGNVTLEHAHEVQSVQKGTLPVTFEKASSPITRRSYLFALNHLFTAHPVMRLHQESATGCEKALHYANLFIISEQMRTRAHIGDFELMVMLVLLRLGDSAAYGVPISREIEQQCGREVALGSVYATLERLEEKGLVSSELGEPTPERGGRAKRYFRVTRKGLREVRETRQALIRLWNGLPALEGGKI
jgi:PadR family transcriptional regulator, regulatory protein PadR